jgi:hypothetical protein
LGEQKCSLWEKQSNTTRDFVLFSGNIVSATTAPPAMVNTFNDFTQVVEVSLEALPVHLTSIARTG